MAPFRKMWTIRRAGVASPDARQEVWNATPVDRGRHSVSPADRGAVADPITSAAPSGATRNPSRWGPGVPGRIAGNRPAQMPPRVASSQYSVLDGVFRTV